MSAPTVADVGMLVWCAGLVSLVQSRLGRLSSFGLSTDAERHPQTCLSSALVVS